MNHYTDDQILERTLRFLSERGEWPGSDGPSELDLTTGHALLVEEGAPAIENTVKNLKRNIAKEMAEYGAANKIHRQNNNNYDPSLYEFLENWIKGKGPDQFEFGPESRNTQNMMDAFRVNQARKYYYNNKNPYSKHNPDKHYTNVKGSFGLEGLLKAGLDPTEQFVGSYRIDINSRLDDKNQAWLDYELNNNTSLKSFLYGIGPDWERSPTSRTPFGNMRQKYKWSERYDPSFASTYSNE